MLKYIKTLFLIISLSISQISFAKIVGGYNIDPHDVSCAGFPDMPIKTLKGTCAGLVLTAEDKDSDGNSLKYPRHILALKDSDDFLVTDMVTWSSFKPGRLWRLNKNEVTGKY